MQTDNRHSYLTRILSVAVLVLVTITPLGVSAERIVAIGDIHGDYQAFAGLLKQIEIIDADGRWRGGATQLVSLGDLLDRGPDSRKVMDLLRELEQQAAAVGGRVHVLLGNHELMNLTGDMRDVSPAEIAAFGGVAEHAQAFSLQGEYGAWLLSKPVALVLGDTLFMHGGLSSAFPSVEAVNEQARTALEQIKSTAEQAQQSGELPVPSALFDLAEEEYGVLGSTYFTNIKAPVFGTDGPLWYRGNARCHALIEEPDVTAKLRALGVERVVVGHTPTRTREIEQRFDGKVWVIDTGMLASVYRGRSRALELVGADETTRVSVLPQGDAELVAIDELLKQRRDDEYEALRSGRIQGDELSAVLFHDEQRYEIELLSMSRNKRRQALAAYLLDREIGLNMIQPVAIRQYQGRQLLIRIRRASVAEQDRDFALNNYCYGESDNGTPFDLVSVFDSLIGKTDRTARNLRYDARSRNIVLTENFGGFANSGKLPSYARTPTLSRALADKLRGLDQIGLKDLLSELLKPSQIAGILKRRDRILEWQGSE